MEFFIERERPSEPNPGLQADESRITSVAWTDRRFTFDLPAASFPSVLERLRGTPARFGDLVSGVREKSLSVRVNRKWSVKEHLGHLADLHALEEQRLREFLAGVPVLSAADMTNRVTETASHNLTPVFLLLERLRRLRVALVRNLEMLTDEQITRTALHPRLQQTMRVLDWAYFITEHDDHHLSQARRLLLATGQRLSLRGEST